MVQVDGCVVVNVCDRFSGNERGFAPGTPAFELARKSAEAISLMNGDAGVVWPPDLLFNVGLHAVHHHLHDANRSGRHNAGVL